MATQQEVDNIIDQIIIDNTTRQIDPAKMRQVLKAINARVPATSDPTVLTVTSPLIFNQFTNNISMPAVRGVPNGDGFLKWTDYIRFNEYASGVKDQVFRLAFKGYQGGVPNESTNIQLNDICQAIVLSEETPGAADFGYYQYIDAEKNDQDPTAYMPIMIATVNAT